MTLIIISLAFIIVMLMIWVFYLYETIKENKADMQNMENQIIDMSYEIITLKKLINKSKITKEK